MIAVKKVDRVFEAPDYSGGGLRILNELDSGKAIEDILEGLGRRKGDPDNYTYQTILRLVSQFRLAIQSASVIQRSGLFVKSQHTAKELSRLSDMVAMATSTDLRLTPQQITPMISAVRERIRTQVNQARANSYRFPL